MPTETDGDLPDGRHTGEVMQREHELNRQASAEARSWPTNRQTLREAERGVKAWLVWSCTSGTEFFEDSERLKRKAEAVERAMATSKRRRGLGFRIRNFEMKSMEPCTRLDVVDKGAGRAVPAWGQRNMALATTGTLTPAA